MNWLPVMQDAPDTKHPQRWATTEEGSIAETAGERSLAARLVIVSSPDKARVGEAIRLGELTVLGREVDAPAQSFADRRMSRVHARVTFDRRAGSYRIGDGNSRNRTFVNGEPIETTLLSEGDVVRIGDTLLVCELRDRMQEARARVQSLAHTPLHVLLRGETGTGKELAARLLHSESGRGGDFVAINCAAIPKDLVAAELFGHTKHAFSGASHARRGVFMAAEQGTLLLDEIADCPLEVQPALLRALQERAVRPVGAERELPIDVRVVTATCVDLEKAVADGRFRPDLYARIAQAKVELPPLRARRAELLKLAEELAGGPLILHPDVAEALLLWDWPLNVRELQSLLAVAKATLPAGALDLQALATIAAKIAQPMLLRSHGAAARSAGARNTASSIPASLLPASPAGAAQSQRPPVPSSFAREQVRPLLEAHGGNVAAVAEALGKPRAQVYRWMRAMGISPDRFRNER